MVSLQGSSDFFGAALMLFRFVAVSVQENVIRCNILEILAGLKKIRVETPWEKTHTHTTDTTDSEKQRNFFFGDVVVLPVSALCSSPLRGSPARSCAVVCYVVLLPVTFAMAGDLTLGLARRVLCSIPDASQRSWFSQCILAIIRPVKQMRINCCSKWRIFKCVAAVVDWIWSKSYRWEQ